MARRGWRWAALLALLAGEAVVAEEVVAFSAAASDPAAWALDGVTAQATNHTLVFTRTPGGRGRAVLRASVANLPESRARLFARGSGTVEVRSGSFTAVLLPAGWDTPADATLPAGAPTWQLAVQLPDEVGAALTVRELLVGGSLDLDPPLLAVRGADASQWKAIGDAGFEAGGLWIRGPVETQASFPPGKNAVGVVRVSRVEGRGVVLAAIARGPDGEPAGEVELGAIGAEGVHSVDLGGRAWPAGTAAVVLRLQPAGEDSSALLTDLWVGRRP